MPVTTLRGPRLLAATALMATLSVAATAGAQFAPYGQPQYGAAQNQYAPYAAAQTQQPQQQQPQYAAQGAYQGYTAPAPTNYAAPRVGFVQQTPIGAQQPAVQNVAAQNYGPYSVPHVAMAYQNGTTPTPAAETLPMTPPVESGAAAMQGGAYMPTPDPAADSYGYGSPAPGAYAPGAGYESYPGQGAAGCATGNCNTGAGYGASCNTGAAYGACDTYSTYGGMNGCISKGAGCGYWFGGVYGLLMDRDNANKYPLVFTSANGAPDGYYPPSNQVVLRTRDADIGFQPGVEFRLGRTFGCGGGCSSACDPCGGCGSYGPNWGLEGVYWTLFEDEADAQYVDSGTIRTYSMMPMAGLEYDPGTGYRPVNEYWDYGPPVRTQDIRVTLARVHSSLEVQNLELNLLRLGVCGGGCGASSYSVACGPSAGGSCDSGYGCATGGCDASGCTTCAPRGPRFSCTGVCGFRWMQFDEDFMYGVDFENTTTLATGFLNYWSTVENNLFGAQVGCNGMYRIGCKWGLHLNSAVGLYGNDVDVRQYMVSPTGQVRFVGSQENFDVMATKTDVAMIGELRLGMSYQATCRTRLYGGWRAIGVTGIALATDQAPAQFLDAAQMGNYVNSSGSMILHGLQAGVEWNY